MGFPPGSDIRRLIRSVCARVHIRLKSRRLLSAFSIAVDTKIELPGLHVRAILLTS